MMDHPVELVDGKCNYVVTEQGSEFRLRAAQGDEEVLTGVSLQLELEIEFPLRVPGIDGLPRASGSWAGLHPKWAPEWSLSTRSSVKGIRYVSTNDVFGLRAERGL